MELKFSAFLTIKHVLIVCLIIVREAEFTGAKSMPVEDVGGDLKVIPEEEHQRIDFKVHILSKRDTSQQEEDTRHIVRTFPASEPLDPNSPLPKDPAEIFADFETVDKIFQPVVSDEVQDAETLDTQSEEEEEEEVKETDGASAETDANDNGKGAQALTDQYSAQRPYSQVTQTTDQGQGSAYDGGQGGYDQTYVQRRVVLTGGNGQPQTETQYTRTHHSSSGVPQTYDTQYVGQVGSQYSSGTSSYNTHNSQYPSGTQRRVYSTGSTGNRYPTYQTSGSNNRGARYNGPRYVDDNGHFIDEHGRHLDSTGQYYDASGRYQDATITRTVTYQTGPSSSQGYVDSSGQGYRYVDQSGGYPSQYSGSSSQTGSGYGTNYGSGTRTGSQYGSTQTGSGGQYGRTQTDGGSQYGRTQTGGGRQYGSTQTGGGSQYGVTQTGGTPVNSYGETQFYSGGQGYPATYDPIVSRISSDPTCPSRGNMQVTINGLSCSNAVSQVGAFVCYNYERVSTECCERCLQVKQAEDVGCEYGDRSYQCRNIQPYDCYNERNSQICCARCQVFREQRSHLESSCGYGDKTPRCQEIVQRSHLCYLPDNQRLCCETCPRLANDEEPDCKWGNQNPELCVPFDSSNRLRINCYMSAVQDLCCATCKSLRDRIRDTVPGCEFGDHPIQISTTQGVLDCGEYIRLYGEENCNGGEIARKCCYTCFRYRQRRQG